MKIIGDLVFETGWRIDLPLNQLFLKPIASNLTQSLKTKTKTKKNTQIQLQLERKRNGEEEDGGAYEFLLE